MKTSISAREGVAANGMCPHAIRNNNKESWIGCTREAPVSRCRTTDRPAVPKRRWSQSLALSLEATSSPQLREEASGRSLAGPLTGQRRRLEVAGMAEQGTRG